MLLASAQPNDLEAAQLEPINVIDGDKGEPDADNKKNFAGARELAEAIGDRGHNIRLMITGHTHWARLVKGAFGNTPYVLVDCGAWIGLRPPW